MGLVRLEKASNVARTYFFITIIQKITKAESVKNIGENFLHDLCTTIFQKVMAVIFQVGGYLQHGNHFVDSFFQRCTILMILVSNHTVVTMQNLNFDLRNSVKAHFKYIMLVSIKCSLNLRQM